jgi:DNA-binding transcriptional ArsR family regulator
MVKLFQVNISSLTNIKATWTTQYFEEKRLDTEIQKESLEESIFKTLSNQKRRDILRFIGENKQATFTQIKKATQIEDSSSVSYHLTNLQPLVTQHNEKYRLSELGQEAYNLIVKTNAYTQTNIVVGILRRQLSLLIIANAILWAIAIFATRQFESALSQNTTLTFVALWLTSNALIYTILRGTSKEKQCLTKLQ